MDIKIGSRIIGDKYPPYFIADIAANHDGDIKRALNLIELAKEAGADAAKFQNFKASTIVSKQGFEQMGGKLSHQKAWDKSVYEVYQEASIPDDWTEKLKEKCDEVSIEYMTSPYDFKSVDLVDPYVRAFKIGSGDITWLDILEYIAQKNKPILLATGASTIEDVKRAVDIIRTKNDSLVLMQCNTNYTANDDNFRYINLNVLNTYKSLFGSVVLGLSDHTRGYETVLGAIALGARVIEKHFTDDNNRIGPDHKFSVTSKEWKEMVVAANKLYLSLGDGVKRIENNELQTALVQRRGLYFTKSLPVGHIIKAEDIFPLRPIKEEQLMPYEKYKIIGKKLNKEVEMGQSVIMDEV